MPTDLALILIIILVIVLIWRGPKTLPVLGQALGRGVKEARKEASEFRESTDPGAAAPASTATSETTAPVAPDPIATEPRSDG